MEKHALTPGLELLLVSRLIRSSSTRAYVGSVAALMSDDQAAHLEAS